MCSQGQNFSILAHYSLALSIPDHVLLQHFWSSLSKESAVQLDIITRGSLDHRTLAEGEALLDHILENTLSIESLRLEMNQAMRKYLWLRLNQYLPSRDPHLNWKLWRNFSEYLGNTLNQSTKPRSIWISTSLLSLNFDLLIGYPFKKLPMGALMKRLGKLLTPRL